MRPHKCGLVDRALSILLYNARAQRAARAREINLLLGRYIVSSQNRLNICQLLCSRKFCPRSNSRSRAFGLCGGNLWRVLARATLSSERD